MEELKRRRASSRGALIKLATVLGVLVLGSLTASAHAQDCVPPCRDGYLCHEGQCIAACNPPCAEGEQCVGEGNCVAAAQESTYTSVDTSGGASVGYATAVDTGGKPSTAMPATFVGLGGFLLIAGGVTFGTSEWSGYYGEYWGTGQWVGVGLMTLGAISVVVATPFLVRQVRAKRNWEREHARALGRDLAVAPIFAPAPRNQTYGITLRGTF